MSISCRGWSSQGKNVFGRPLVLPRSTVFHGISRLSNPSFSAWFLYYHCKDFSGWFESYNCQHNCNRNSKSNLTQATVWHKSAIPLLLNVWLMMLAANATLTQKKLARYCKHLAGFCQVNWSEVNQHQLIKRKVRVWQNLQSTKWKVGDGRISSILN